MLDVQCVECGFEANDIFVMAVPSRIVHFGRCGGAMEQVLRARTASHQWADRDAVLVFKNPDGTYRYPGRNDVATPTGCERVLIKDMAALRRLEREGGVVSHIANYDSNGRSFDGL